jgi:hypothetical protein
MKLKEIIRRVLKEEVELPPFIRRRLNFDDDEIIYYLRKFAIRVFEPDKRIEDRVLKACRNTAYELLSPITDIDDNVYDKIEDKLTYFLRDKYGERLKDFIRNFYNESGDSTDKSYQIWRHNEKNVGEKFVYSFDTWNELLSRNASLFPNLDWADIKETLDSGPDRKPLLIVEPDDKFNSTGYYYSLVKIDRKNPVNFNQKESKKITGSLLKEDSQQKILSLINKHGIGSIIDMVGGYSKLKELVGDNLTKEMKIDVIISYTEKNDGWVSLNDSDDDFVYKETEDGEKFIEYLTSEGVVVVTYEKQGDDWEKIDEYYIWYGHLPDNIFDKIFDLVIKYIEWD